MPSAREPENLARMLHCGGKASGELRSIGRGPGGELEATLHAAQRRPTKMAFLAYAFG